ncbi:MAG: LPS export ABC transporter ATP-binding protein [Negativicutes bacterium]|jgi:lipopolysaccharide export system ATP-binding protein
MNVNEIKTIDLVKKYNGRTVVNNVSVSLCRGEVVGLLGANGAGKTTTFYMITGLVKPNSGKIFINGEDVSRLPMHKRAAYGLAYLPQEASVFRKLTVEENLLAILQMQNITKARQLKKTNELIKEFNLEHVRHSLGMALSGGERRRCEIARALVNDPQFILLDEPFAGVDPIAVAAIQELIKYLKNRGVGILITDHNVRETLNIVDRAYIINNGQVLLSGDPQYVANHELARKYFFGENFVF